MLLRSLLLLLCTTNVFCAPASVPRNMWAPGVFPKAVKRVSARQVLVSNNMDHKKRWPAVMKDLSQPPGRLDMDDEFLIPHMMHYAVRSDEEVEITKDQDEGKSQNKIEDDDSKDQLAQLLYGTYGQYSAVGVVPVVDAKAYAPVVPVVPAKTYASVVPVVKAKTYVPVVPVVPVVEQQTLHVPQAVAVLQPQSVSQVGSQAVVLATNQQSSLAQSSVAASGQTAQQGGVAVPQPAGAAQSLPQSPAAIQPQAVAQPLTGAQPQPVAQPQAVVPAAVNPLQPESRMQLPTGSGVSGTQPATGQLSGGQTPVLTQSQQSSVVVQHRSPAQRLHIIIPKSKKQVMQQKGYKYK